MSDGIKALSGDLHLECANLGTRVPPPMSKTVYVVAGEVSGDTHGAELMAALGPQEFRGLGGPAMRKIGGEHLQNWVDEAAVVGVWEVLRRYSWFKKRFADTLAEIIAWKPDLLLLIDYPGFNLRLAKQVKAKLPETKIVHYVAPQVWAWNQKRIPQIAASHDLMLCLFPFEVEIFENAGLRAVCPGHPLVDELEAQRSHLARAQKLVGLFPGSRMKEVSRLFPLMLEVVKLVRSHHPDLAFITAASSKKIQRLMEDAVQAEQMEDVVKIQLGESQKLMQEATIGMVASGTATLEAAYYGMPYCLVYQVAWPTYLMARQLVDLEHIGLINILAKEELVPEFIQGEANVYEVSTWLREMIQKPEKRQHLTQRLLKTASSLGGPGVHERAAQEILTLLSE